MATRVETIEFLPESVSVIASVMDGLAADNSGWVTIDPAILQEHQPPTQSVFGRMIGNRGPYVPRSTWVPADVDRRRPEPMSVGVLHARGPRVAAQLEESGVAVPDRWRVVADHPKRGLVAYVPVEVAHVEIVEWIMAAATALTRIPLTGEWRASIHRP